MDVSLFRFFLSRDKKISRPIFFNTDGMGSDSGRARVGHCVDGRCSNGAKSEA